MDRDIFLRPQGNRTKTAKAVCERCPCEMTCLFYGMSLEMQGLRFGIFGALGPEQRDDLAIAPEIADAVYRGERSSLWSAHISVQERFAV